jgi:hypothetical protein
LQKLIKLGSSADLSSDEGDESLGNDLSDESDADDEQPTAPDPLSDAFNIIAVDDLIASGSSVADMGEFCNIKPWSIC